MTERSDFFLNLMLDTHSNSNVLDRLMLELARYPNFGEYHMLELARYPNFLMLVHPYSTYPNFLLSKAWLIDHL